MIRCYPTVEVVKQSFKSSKKVTVPNQTLTLREIIQRFTRRESLPIEKHGFYEERFGDLEKMARQDVTVQMEYASRLKEAVKDAREREKKAKESPSAGSPPSSSSAPSSAPPAPQPGAASPPPTGGVTGKPDVGQAP